MGLEVVQPPETVEARISTLVMEPDLRTQIINAQRQDDIMEKIRAKVRSGDEKIFKEETDNALTFDGRICVPNNDELINKILSEAHDTPYTAHPGSTKIISSTNGWTVRKNDSGPRTIQKQIRLRIKEAQDRKKSYVDARRTKLKFNIGDKVFLKVSPSKGITRFGIKGKLKPRFIGPYEILDEVGPVAYRLALPPSLENVHNVFHVSQLRKYVYDPKHIIHYEEVSLTPDLNYEEKLIAILDQKIQQLRNKSISAVKVLWNHHGQEEATWELEEKMREQYTEMFM
ncbi:uncharacterized protein LOC121784216 [Salvia splendens]|uniref:uncharacterized protein LOC121784216 n=1 Tax=Salvia splendens TaxID=180675 RepID=UPI001C27EECD|nr:uncharacterized protein LOC121784216 [Salvia splendens]